MARLKSRILSSLKTSIQLTLALAIFAAIWGYHNFNKPRPVGADSAPDAVVVRLMSGLSLGAISDQLAQAGVIDDPRLFRWAVRLKGLGTSLKAGEYEFASVLSMQDVMDQISLGQVMQHRLTIPEGTTTAAAITLINADERLSGVITNPPAEGRLLPETYLIRRDDDRQVVLDRMGTAMDAFIAEAWDSNTDTRYLRTPDEVLTLASIVERETALARERAHVAGVFRNRLRLGMRLQSDPTVRYALMLAGRMDHGSTRPLLRSELSLPHAYNTYVERGLPPGPIANPGAASIMAVLAPMATEDLYFVADGNGGHAFAKTLREHEENVRHWRASKAMRD